MKTKIDSFLNSINDVELAFLFHFNFNTYLKGSQLKILDEIQKRNLSQSKINYIIKEIQFNKKYIPENGFYCPRCFSKKLYTRKIPLDHQSDAVAFMPESYQNGIETKDISICQVCGFNLFEDRKPNKILKWIKEKLKYF